LPRLQPQRLCDEVEGVNSCMIIQIRRMNRHESGNARTNGLKTLINPRGILGLALLLTGAPATFYSYFILRSVHLAAVWMSATIIGMTALFVTFGIAYSTEEECSIFKQKFKSFILSLIAAFGGLNFVLAATKETALSVYFIANALAFMVLVLAYHDFSPATKSRLHAAATVIFAAFVAIVLYKVSLTLMS